MISNKFFRVLKRSGGIWGDSIFKNYTIRQNGIKKQIRFVANKMDINVKLSVSENFLLTIEFMRDGKLIEYGFPINVCINEKEWYFLNIYVDSNNCFKLSFYDIERKFLFFQGRNSTTPLKDNPISVPNHF